MELKHLHTLLAVAEHGSFSAAARAIHTVQSNVSTHIARLEEEVGAPLVDRRSGRLTEEGEAVLARARRVQSELDALLSDVAALRDEVTGSVRAGMIGSIGRWLVPRLLADMARLHPAVDLVIVDATTTSLLPQLHEGTLDMAVANLPVFDPELVEEALLAEERVLVVPLGHPLADHDADGAITVEMLEGHRLVLQPRGTAFRDVLDRAVQERGVQLRAAAEVDGMMLVASLATGGLAPAILPATAMVDQPDGDWVQLPLDLRPRTVGLVHRRAGRLGAPARAFADLLRAVIAEEGARLRGIVPGAPADDALS